MGNVLTAGKACPGKGNTALREGETPEETLHAQDGCPEADLGDAEAGAEAAAHSEPEEGECQPERSADLTIWQKQCKWQMQQEQRGAPWI